MEQLHSGDDQVGFGACMCACLSMCVCACVCVCARAYVCL